MQIKQLANVQSKINNFKNDIEVIQEKLCNIDKEISNIDREIYKLYDEKEKYESSKEYFSEQIDDIKSTIEEYDFLLKNEEIYNSRDFFDFKLFTIWNFDDNDWSEEFFPRDDRLLSAFIDKDKNDKFYKDYYDYISNDSYNDMYFWDYKADTFYQILENQKIIMEKIDNEFADCYEALSDYKDKVSPKSSMTDFLKEYGDVKICEIIDSDIEKFSKFIALFSFYNRNVEAFDYFNYPTSRFTNNPNAETVELLSTINIDDFLLKIERQLASTLNFQATKDIDLLDVENYSRLATTELQNEFSRKRFSCAKR